MEGKKMKARLGLFLLLVFFAVFLVTKTPLIPILAASPWWMYVVILGIFISGGFSIKYTLEERKKEREWIEQEGNVYLERIELERGKRKMEKASNNVSV